MSGPPPPQRPALRGLVARPVLTGVLVHASREPVMQQRCALPHPAAVSLPQHAPCAESLRLGVISVCLCSTCLFVLSYLISIVTPQGLKRRVQPDKTNENKTQRFQNLQPNTSVITLNDRGKISPACVGFFFYYYYFFSLPLVVFCGVFFPPSATIRAQSA